MQVMARIPRLRLIDIGKDFRDVTRACGGYLRAAFLFSLAVNLLYVTPSLYMMNVYDRVLSSRSELTLAMLTVVAVLALVSLAVLDNVRTQILVRASVRFDRMLSARLLTAQVEHAAAMPGVQRAQSVRDLDTVRQFVTGSGIVAFFDVPWAIIYMVLTFMLSPTIGVVAVFGSAVVGVLAWLGERATQPRMSEAGAFAIKNYGLSDTVVANVDVVQAMGMLPNMLVRWSEQRRGVLANQASASDVAGLYQSAIKFLRMFLQSIIVGVGAMLVLENSLSGGGLYAAVILMGRMMQPVEQISSIWSHIAQARDAFARVNALLSAVPARQPAMPLPRPTGRLDVDRVVYSPPGRETPILRGVSFSLAPGEALAVIGPSGAGKSTLSRVLTGVWRPQAGSVRLDGADVATWDRSDIGPHIGYLAQDIELFDGSVRENIARFTDAPADAVLAAAAAAGLHEIILSLPKGYETQIGEAGVSLSGGQRQRIGLARALFGDPAFLVLDEPNSNLDSFGEDALGKALLRAKQMGSTIVIVSHRNGILGIADKILYLKDGLAEIFGPRDQVLARLSGNVQPRAVAAVPAPTVSS